MLEDLGWKLHRIWSTDWFNDPRKEADRLRTVIAATLAEFKLRVSEFDGGMKATRSSVPEPIQVPASVIRSEPQEVDEQKSSIIVPLAAVKDKSVEIGDTVRVRYLSDDKKTVRITISKTLSDPDNGVIHFETPIAKALLGAEEGDEVDVLVGSYVRPAIVESISKNAN